MVRWIQRIGLIAAVGVLAGGCPKGSLAPPDRGVDVKPLPSAGLNLSHKSAREVADLFFKRLIRKDFHDAVALFSPKMAKVMSPSRLAKAWKKVLDQAGEFKSVEAVRKQTVADTELIIFTLAFSRHTFDLQLSIDHLHHVAGMHYRPSPAEKINRPLPPYADRARVRELSVTIGSAPWKLPGKLTLPKKVAPKTPPKGKRAASPKDPPKGKRAASPRTLPFPAVILVHGSGPQDADETIGPNKPFRDLAWGLATRGIAVLRYAKRTLVHRKAATAALETLTLKEESIDDTLAALAILKKHPAIDPQRIFILGHSLGGYALPRIAQRSRGHLAGLIFMGANSRPLEALILAQWIYLTQLDGRVTAHERQRLARLKEKIARLKEGPKPKTPRLLLPLNLTAAYWRDLRAHPVLAAIRKVHLPMLFLQGGRDYQVTLKDLAGWKKALRGRRHVHFKIYPKANHLLIDGKGTPTPLEYKKPGYVKEEAIADIASFVLSTPRR